MNKKILTSGISIVAALALTAGGAFALFSDTASSQGNTFTSGSINLLLDDDDETTPSESVVASIIGSNMLPGATPVAGFISLHNDGNNDIAEIEMTTTATESLDPGNDSFLPNVINMTVMTGDNSTCTVNQTDYTGILATQFGGTSPLTLAELNGNTFDAFPGIAALGSDKYVCMTAQMDASASNVYQGDSVSVDFAFTGNQEASQ